MHLAKLDSIRIRFDKMLDFFGNMRTLNKQTSWSIHSYRFDVVDRWTCMKMHATHCVFVRCSPHKSNLRRFTTHLNGGWLYRPMIVRFIRCI